MGDKGAKVRAAHWRFDAAEIRRLLESVSCFTYQFDVAV